MALLLGGISFHATMLRMFRIRLLVSLALTVALLMCTSRSSALSLAAPAGGAAIALPDGKVACTAAGGGWQVAPNGTTAVPPTDPAQVGKTYVLRIAASGAACSQSRETLALLVAAASPIVDRRSIDLWVDEGRLELRGANLDGTRIEWSTKDEHGSDACLVPSMVQGQQSCSYEVRKHALAELSAINIHLFPAIASQEVWVFDSGGHRIPAEGITMPLTRLVVGTLLNRENHVDLSDGEDRVPLAHPEAITSVDCDGGRCDLIGSEVRVRGVTSSARVLNLKLRLAPHVYVRSGDALAQSITLPLNITYCPLTVVSPLPIRETDDARVVVKLEARCAANPESIRFSGNGNPVAVLDNEFKDEYVYLLLGLGRIASDRLTLTASRGAFDGSVIGITSTQTAPPPQLRISLFVAPLGEIDFVPTNRDAVVSVTSSNLQGNIITLPVPGVYAVKEKEGRTEIRGEATGGYVTLHFALRDDSLPGRFADADLAHFKASIQHAIHELNVAAPLGAANSKTPIAEVLCTSAMGRTVPVQPGVPLHVAFAQRDGCRLVIHREGIPVDYGEQRVNVNVEVTSVAGSARADGHFAQRLLLRNGKEPMTIWLRGVKSQFDRITVQLTHVTEQDQYLRGGRETIEVPAATWTIIVENTNFRLYATASIPVQLFRFSSDSNGAGNGPLSLNLGVLSRFTWVSREGTEGILGLEGGVMGMGLATSNTRQLNIVMGFGLGVPLGNAGQTSQASINLHAWAAYRLGNEYASRLDASGNAIAGQFVGLHHWSFIFGPSVTFGNLGFDL